MSKYYVHISGSDIELARAEIESLVDLHSIGVGILWYGRLGFIDCKSNPIPFLLSRAALVREVGNVLHEGSDPETLLNRITKGPLTEILNSKRSFSVRIYTTDYYFEEEEKQQFIIDVGKRIQEVTRASVSLNHADVNIVVNVIHNKVVLCEAFKSYQRQVLTQRTPSARAFFHPSMMNALLARVMCNIASVQPDQSVLDPFCGGGGILCEAALIGAQVTGIDMNWRLLKGAQKNLIDLNISDFSLIQGDSRKIPVSYMDSIVTDPPYGRTSSTRGENAIRLVSSLIEQSIEFVENGGRLCICGSQEMNMRNLFDQVGLSVKYDILIPIHSGLTRNILAVEL
ncbi:MAG: methyltransferase domain-containing protein [Candidatus Thorarchaeota archaeon]|nr:methyltransferase domain-containing protein [Candidatus Thorarchaeota archaeon]